MTQRTVSVSTDVYAAIWAARQPGEDLEDQILRRVLKVPLRDDTKSSVGSSPTKIGFRDPRFGIELPEGFEIFRTYLGTQFRARATDGKWKLLSTGASYPSLNQLSTGIGAKTENAWRNWYFDRSGKRMLIESLRK